MITYARSLYGGANFIC